MKRNLTFSSNTNDSFYLSFTDVMTLLLIFFIYLVSIATFNQQDIETLSKVIQGKAIQSIKLDPSNKQNNESNDIKQIKANEFPTDGIRISLDQELLFSPGSATLRTESTPYLQTIADVLKTKAMQIIVEGHTDSNPINTKEFPSNWHLSSMRAASVAKKLNDLGIPNHHLSSRGFSDTRPLIEQVLNASDHQKNRRVQLYIKPINGGN